MATKPTLSTRRLLLRPPCKGDLEELVALGADPEVMRFLGDGSTQTPDQAADWLSTMLRLAESDPPGLPGWLVAIRREDDAWIGLAVLKRMAPRHEEALGEGLLVEVGYRLARPYWGRGYATEAAEALLKYGFLAVNLPTIVAIADARNVTSNRVIQKIGLIHRRTYHLDGRDIRFHSLWRKEYEAVD
jgi:RimJ/RimL family protein N-acetyltransferase